MTFSIQKKVESERVRYLFTNAPRSVPFNVINSIILVLVFWPEVNHVNLLAWFLMLFAASVVRLLHTRRFLKHGVIENDHVKAEQQFMAGAFVTGAIWGVGYLIFATQTSGNHQLLYLLVLAGMASGAYASMGTSTRVYTLYLLPMLIPGTVFSLLGHTTIGITAGVMILIYTVVLLSTHRLSAKMLTDGFRLKFENDDLVYELSNSNKTLKQTNQALHEAKENLQVISLTDELTGLANRRNFSQLSKKEWARSVRQNQPIACLMIDIDHFKLFNDYYGHQKGDDCLAKVAAKLKKEIQRPEDIIARYGGEEFIALLPGTNLSGAVLVAERMINSIKEADLSHNQSPEGKVTISIGISTVQNPRSDSLFKLIKSADDALYNAKESGRNRMSMDNSAIGM